jgi:hypothetical protein
VRVYWAANVNGSTIEANLALPNEWYPPPLLHHPHIALALAMKKHTQFSTAKPRPKGQSPARNERHHSPSPKSRRCAVPTS